MTVAVDTTRLEYRGTGSTVVFTFPWRLLTPSDLTVFVNHVQRVDFVITGGLTDAGGFITFASPPALDSFVWLIRQIPQTQPYDLHEFDTMSAESQELSFDRVTLLLQDLQSQVDRCIQFRHTAHLTGPPAISNVFPLPGHGQFIKWNLEGTQLEVGGVPSGGGDGGGDLTGEGEAGQVAFWTAPKVLRGDAKLLWDNDAKFLTVGTLPLGPTKPGNIFAGLQGPMNAVGMQNLQLQTVQGDPSLIGLVTLGDDRVGLSSWNFRGTGAANPIYGANFGVVFNTPGVANGLEIDVQNDMPDINYQGQALWLNGSTRAAGAPGTVGHRANAILIDTQDGSKWERGILFKEGFVANGATGSIEKMGIHFEHSQDADFIVIQPRLGTSGNIAVKLTNPEFTVNRFEILNSGAIRVGDTMTGPAFPSYAFVEDQTSGMYMEGPSILGFSVSGTVPGSSPPVIAGIRRMTLGDALNLYPVTQTPDNTGTIKFWDQFSVHSVGIMAPDFVGNSFRIKLPQVPGPAGYCLVTSGPSGSLGAEIESWSYAPCGTGGGGGGGGTVTNSGGLDANALVLGAGGITVMSLGVLGTTNQVLHGNAGGAPTFSAVNLAADVSGRLPYANLATASAASTLLGRGVAGAGDWQEITLGANLTMTGTTLAAGGAGAGAPTTATYWTATADVALSAEVNLGALTTGLLLNTVSAGTGTPSTYAGTSCTGQFVRSLDALGVATCAPVALATDVSGDLPFSSLAGGTALSVLGVAGNAPADVASIAAGTDGTVLRRSGTALGFGAIDLSSSTAVANRVPYGNLPSASAGSILVGRGSAGLGDLQEITLGPNLTMSGTVLNATAGGLGDVVGPASAIDSEVALFDLATGKLLKRATGSGPARLTAGVLGTGATSLATEVTGVLPLANVAPATAASLLLGRGSAAGAGDWQELTLGANLSISGTTLNAAAGGGGAPITATYITQTPDATLVSEQALSLLATGYMLSTTATGVVSTQTATQVTASLDLFTSALKGLVPSSGGGTVNFLRADGNWAAPGGGGNVTTGTLTTNRLVVASGATAVVSLGSLGTTTTVLHGNAGGLPTFGAVALGTDVTGTLAAAQFPALTGDVTTTAGSLATTIIANVVTNVELADMVSARIKGRVTVGTGNPEDLTGTQATTLLDVFTSTLKGLVPLSGGGTVNFLRADGTWAAPVAGGSGNVTAGGTLALNALVLGQGTSAVATLGTLGTPTTVLHGNAGGAPTFGAVVLTADVSGRLPYANLVAATAASRLVGRTDASAGDWQEITLGANLTMTGTTLAAATGTGAPLTSTYWTSSADATLINERNMGALTTGLVLNTVSAGVGTPTAYGGSFCTNQFVRSLNASGVATCAAVANADLANSTITVTGTPNRVIVTGSPVALGGTVTLTGPQDLHTAAAPVFSTLTLSANANELVLGTTNTTTITMATITAPRTFILPDANSNPVRPAVCGAGSFVSAIASSGLLTCTAGGGSVTTSGAPAANELAFFTAGTVISSGPNLRWDPAGNVFLVQGPGTLGQSIIGRNYNLAGAPVMDEGLGLLAFTGVNTVPALAATAAEIRSNVDGTGVSRVKGRLTFHTSDGTGLLERLRIASDGAVSISGPVTISPTPGVIRPLTSFVSTASTTGNHYPLWLIALSTGQMVNGFGPAILFSGYDQDAILRNAGQMGYRRAGADDTWLFAINTTIGGASADRLVVAGDSTIGFYGTPTVSLVVLNANAATRMAMQFNTDNNASSVALRAPATSLGNITWTLPSTITAPGGGSGVLTTDAAGNMAWASTAAAVSTTGTPAANQMTFMTGANTISSSPNFAFNTGTGVLTLLGPGSLHVGITPFGGQAAGPVQSTVSNSDNTNPYQALLGQIVNGSSAGVGAATTANDKVAVSGWAHRGAGGTSPIYGGNFTAQFSTVGVAVGLELGVINTSGTNGIGNGLWVNGGIGGGGFHRDNAILIDTQDSSKWTSGIRFTEGNTGLGATGSVLSYGIIFDKSHDADFLVIRPRVGASNIAIRITDPTFTTNRFYVTNNGVIGADSMGLVGTLNVSGDINTAANIGAVQYFANALPGQTTVTKTVGACTFTFTGGILTGATGGAVCG